MKAKVLIPAVPIVPEAIEMLKDANFTVKKLESNEIEYLKKEIVEADAVLVRTGKVNREVIENGKRLKILAYHGAGVDGIDIDAATKHKIYVTKTPTANSISVAEHVIGLMIALAKKIAFGDAAIRKGDFNIRNQVIGTELEGKTLGIIGLGNIGQRLALKASLGLGMNVIGYDPFTAQKDVHSTIRMTNDWDEVFANADYISLNLPLNSNTRNSVGKKEFRIMKDTAVIINTSRGPIINETELIEALRNKEIAGAGLDVFEKEPPIKDNLLFQMPNTVLTPHIASTTKEAMFRMGTQAAGEIISVLNGELPKWPINSID